MKSFIYLLISKKNYADLSRPDTKTTVEQGEKCYNATLMSLTDWLAD